ncbi:hypothetical protein ACLI1A_13245 [Flavobacterium sp. RHBU_3]|uniref:hypothetical protein n=1 Tax=Flavobacterium sp. RHBU_3 TaxID=3391184 RepID=UPI003985064F
MKNLVLTLIISVLAIACQKKKEHHYTAVNTKCGLYKDGIKSGKYPNKTTTVQVNDTVYKMDFVRDHNDKWPACSTLEASVDVFAAFLKHAGLNKQYPEAANVRLVTLYAGINDIEKAEMLQWSNIAAYSVTYRGKDNFGYTAFTDLKNNKTEIYKISNAYASVKKYFLQKRTDVTQNPSIVEFTNTGFNGNGAKLVDINDDTLYATAEEEE